MPQRIIFLDIDGPVIPGHLYDTDPVAPHRRELFDIAAVGRLNQLCGELSAKIVTNSMHNHQYIDRRSLQDDLVRWGLDRQHLHSCWRTVFPRVDYAANPNPRRGWGRWLGIDQWIKNNGECDWVCFDDRNWSDDARLIVVDFELGITDADVDSARQQFADQASAAWTAVSQVDLAL